MYLHPRDLGLKRHITPSPRRQAQWILSLPDTFVVSGQGDRQDSADRLDPMDRAVIIDKSDHRLHGRSSSACAKYADALRKISLAYVLGDLFDIVQIGRGAILGR